MHKDFLRFENEQKFVYSRLDAVLQGKDKKPFFLELRRIFLEEVRTIFALTNNDVSYNSYILNYACYQLVNKLNINRYSRDFDYNSYDLLSQLIDFLPEVREKHKDEFFDFFADSSEAEETTIVVPSHFKRLQGVLESYGQKSLNLENRISRMNDGEPLRKIVTRFPSIYADYLSLEANHYVKDKLIKEKKEKVDRFSVNLFQYIRGRKIRQEFEEFQGNLSTQVVPKTADNPTKLKEEDVVNSIRFFADAKKNRDVRLSAVQNTSIAVTKEQLAQVILDYLPVVYQKGFFGQKLMDLLKNIISSKDSSQVSSQDILVIVDCLFNFLVVDNNKNHYIFVDLLSNLGTRKVLGLICQLTSLIKSEEGYPIKEIFDKKLALLYRHYSNFSENDMDWFLRFLENYNVSNAVFCSNFDDKHLL